MRSVLKLLPLLVALPLLLFAPVPFAQPGEPGSPGESGLPDHAGPPDDDPSERRGPPDQASGSDDQEDGDERRGPPDFCSSDGIGKGPNGDGPNDQAGLSSIAHLEFNAEGREDDESWARLTYRWIAPVFDYVYNAHNLPPGEDFTLTYQSDPENGEGQVICLGTSTVNEEGDLHVQDAFDLASDLPTEDAENQDEATLVLVPAEDVTCEDGAMAAWNPIDYVFSDEGMFYVDSDLEEEEEEEEEGEDGEG